MEGSGEGIAALRWLSDAGLAFSFLSHIRSRRTQETGIQPALPPSRNSSNAVASQTLCKHHYKRWRCINEPYASTYQVSHGSVDTSYHAGWHTEFPPQRQKPSLALGNFEVGNTSRCRSSARTDIHSYRASRDATASAGCKFRPQQERYVEAFVESLRKYPCATQRSPTAEMLEQLLKTSRKHSPKQSQVTTPPKKRCHHWDKPRPLASSTPYASRYKENYRRLRRKKGANAEVNSDEKEYSMPGGRVSFDYLNSGARSPAEFVAKTIDNKIFKNVFRDIFRDKREPVTAFPVCPTLEDRYRKHVKKYHPTTSQIPYTDFEDLAPCSKCLQTRPCGCDTARGLRRTVGNDDKEEQAKRQFEDAIFSWLKEIPVYPNEDPSAKFTRDAIVKKLAETLSGLKNGVFAVEGKEEIKRALDEIPMWYPKGKRERDRFKDDITDNLLEKIKGIKELEKFYETTKDFFNDLQFLRKIDIEQLLDDFVTELHKIILNRPESIDMYRDLLKIKAFELLNGLPIKTSGNIYEYLNKLSDELADCLINVSTKSFDTEYKRNISDAITNMLDETNVSVKDRQTVEEELSAIIADVVAHNIDREQAETYIKSILDGKVPNSEVQNITNKALKLVDIQIDPNNIKIIKENICDILDKSNAQFSNRDKIEESLTKLIADITTKGIDKEKVKSRIRSLLKGKVSEGKLEKITENMLTLADRVKPIDNDTTQFKKEDIRAILDFSDVQIKNKDKVETDLTKLVSDITKEGMDENKAKNHIESLLKGKIPEENLKDITKRVLTLAGQVKPIDNETKQILKKDVSNILDHSDIQIQSREKIEVDLSKLVADITTKGMAEDKAKSHIESLLKGKVPKADLKEITKRVLTLAGQVKPIDDETKQIIKHNVSNILDLSDIQIKNREKIEEDLSKVVADISTKSIEEDKAKSHIDSLLKGKVPKEDLKDITKRVLSLADQVKPIDNETKQIIKLDVSNILDLSDVQIKNRDKVEEDLSNLVADISTKGIEEGKAKSHIESLLKGKVPKEDLNDITKRVLTLAGQVKPIDTETKQIIKHDVSNILDLSDVQIKDREKVEEDLSKLVADITTKGMEEGKAKSHIESLLKGKVPKEDLKDITKRMLTLADQVKPIANETKQIIKHDVINIPDLSDIQIKNRDKVEEDLSKLVADISTKGIEEGKAKSHIESLLKGKVPKEDLKDITKRVLTLAGQVKPIDTETKKIIKHDVSNILDLSDVQIKDREKVEEDLSKLVADITTKGMEEGKAKSHIESLLKGKVPKEDLKDITKRMLTLADQVKPMDNETKQIIKNEISNILDLYDVQIKDREKVEEDLNKLVADIITNGMEEGKAKSHIESLVKGKVPKEDLKDITKRMLTLAGRVKPIDNETQQILKHDVSNIEESLREIPSDLIMRGMDTSKAQDYTFKGNVSDSQVEDTPRRFAVAGYPSLTLSENGREPVAHSTQNEEKILFDQVCGVMNYWLKFRDITLSNKKLSDVAEAIANEALDRRKYLQLNPGFKTSEAMESEILKEQIYKVLTRLIDKKSVQLIMIDIEDLMRSLKQIPPFQTYKDSSEVLIQDSKQFIQENLEGAMLDWLRSSPIYQNRNIKIKQSQEQVILKLASSLAAVLSSPAIQKPGTNPDEVLLKEISKYIEKLDLETELKSKIHNQKLSSNLLDYLKSLQLFQNISVRDSQKQIFTSKDLQGTKTSFMASTNHLNASVKDWCENLQISDTDQRIKQDLANKIMIKIGEMNMNQDILNDDLLYDEILQDFIDQQVNELQIDKQITDADKKVLLDQIKQIKHKVQDDFIGKKYKQQLRDSISNALPVLTSPTEDDKASFELMKENLADAFINLNYSVDDDTARNKFKRRIMDEVNKYVDNYLKRYPATPVNTKKLNEDLYTALKNVPVPDNESMRTEVESVRIKDIINDWLKTLPMCKQSKSEQLHTNKIVTLMAQKLQQLENEFRPDFEEIAVAEIVMYLKKLPLRNKNNLHGMANKLVEKIKNTAESRAFVERSRSNLTDDCLCEDFPMSRVPGRTGLRIEDQDIMQGIRERSLFCEAGTQSRRCRDAAVNPPPLDNGSQTEMPYPSQASPRTVERPEQVCSKPAPLQPNRIPIGTRPGPSAVGQSDLSPCIQVKQYHWDSCLDNQIENATGIPADKSGRIFIPSSPLNSERICRPRTTPRRVPVKPHARLEYPTCRKPTPKRQLSSACPNDYYTRPKHCSRPPIFEREHLKSSCRHVGPSCGRMRSPCLSCQENFTSSRNSCAPMHVCPRPTCLYFE